MSAISLVKTWREFLLTDCPVKAWDQLLEEYGECQAATKYRLDTQLVRFREDCKFFGVAPLTVSDLEGYMPDKVCCDVYLEECQIRLNDLAPAVSIKDI